MADKMDVILGFVAWVLFLCFVLGPVPRILGVVVYDFILPWVVPLAFLGFVVCLVINKTATLYKFKLYVQAIGYLVKSKDKKWKPHPVPPTDACSDKPGVEVERRTLIFLRHGESTWNDTFNRTLNPIFFVPRLVKAIIVEMYLLASGQQDSWFYDSPLSDEGVEQAQGLREYLAGNEAPDTAHFKALRGGKASDSMVVSSNLRRSISTVSVALFDRLTAEDEKMQLLTCLQEVSTNPDTLCLTPSQTIPTPSWVDTRHSESGNVDIASIYSKHTDPALCTGNKPMDSNGLKRLLAFSEWVFQQKNQNIIVGGHSLYFRYFFRTFWPGGWKGVDHPALNNKIANGGAIALTFCKVSDPAKPSQTTYAIDVASIEPLFLGFDGVGMKKVN
eukprot:TRINITY_DN15022_c0_g1_i1.p1 TRINITY_DN15022_c0_g1~~TRINITY_DN15022_c0_g1_i1.p1  ORF type:complete len:389 (-),score=80.88 TRINITY_DN15022_c0_g1_i1:41-1207(-)